MMAGTGRGRLVTFGHVEGSGLGRRARLSGRYHRGGERNQGVREVEMYCGSRAAHNDELERRRHNTTVQQAASATVYSVQCAVQRLRRRLGPFI